MIVKESDTTVIAVVRAWHDALNAGDLDRLAALMAEDVELGGPRGAGRGVALVRDWAGRAGIELEPVRWFQRDGTVVVAQRARWRAPDTGEPGPPQDAASLFVLGDDLIRRVVRYDTLQEALAGAGISEGVRVTG